MRSAIKVYLQLDTGTCNVRTLIFVPPDASGNVSSPFAIGRDNGVSPVCAFLVTAPLADPIVSLPRYQFAKGTSKFLVWKSVSGGRSVFGRKAEEQRALAGEYQDAAGPIVR